MTTYPCPLMLEDEDEKFQGKRRRLSDTFVDVSEPGKDYVLPGINCDWVQVFPSGKVDSSKASSSKKIIQKEHLSQIMKNITGAVGDEQAPVEASEDVKKVAKETPGIQKRSRDIFEQFTLEEHKLDAEAPAETTSEVCADDRYISQNDVEAAGRKILDLFTLEKRMMENVNKMLEEESRKRARERAEDQLKHKKEMQALEIRHEVRLQALRVELKRSELFSADMFTFTCDVMENILVKLSYAIQKCVAEAIQDSESSFKREDFSQVFEERNLAFLCYGRVLKRWLQLSKITQNNHLQLLKKQQRSGVEEEDEEDEVEEDDEEDQPEGDQAIDELDEEEREAYEDEKKKRSLLRKALRWLPKFLKRAEALVAEELGVGSLKLKLTAAVYIFRLKPDRNLEAHRNQLHNPPQWRSRSFDENPVTQKLLDACLSPAPDSEPSPLLESFKNILMLDIVEEKLMVVLGSDGPDVSEEVVVKVIRLIRSRACSNIAEKFMAVLSSKNKRLVLGGVLRRRGLDHQAETKPRARAPDPALV